MDDLNAQYETLKTLFESDPKKAIAESQNIILKISHIDSNQKFVEYFREHGQISSCTEESTDYCLSVSCLDCSLDSGIFLCLDCFFNGNHQGHKCIVFADLYGSCDCGDPHQMKSQGFCKKHKGLPEDDQIPNNLSKNLTEILTDVVFKAAFASLTRYTQSETQNACLILNFLTSFLKFDDIFRRLLSISLTEKIDLKNLMCNITNYSSQFNSALQTFCGKLGNDYVFIKNFSKIAFDLIMANILDKQILITANHFLLTNIECWNYFWFQCFTKKSLEINIIQKKWDWVTYIISFAKKLFQHFSLKIDTIYDMYPYYKDIISSFPYAAKIQPNEETQNLFDRFCNEILNCEVTDKTVIPISYLDKGNDYLKSILLFNISFYDIFNCFKYKPNLKFESLFNQLEKLIDISSIYFDNNNKFALKFLNIMNNNRFPSYYYQSFHNGASFFYSNPIYDSLVTLFGLENICRIKIARFLSLEKNQPLRFKLLIITLKKLLSFVAYQADVIPKNNFDLYDIIGFIANSTSRMSLGFPLFFPLFQLLVGLKAMNSIDEFSMKEFVSFEMAKLLGIFDNFSGKEYECENIDEKLNDMIFSFLYFIILIVVERTLFNYDHNEFIKEQLVYAIKSGYAKMSKLQSFCDNKVLDTSRYPLVFNESLIQIATIQRCNTNRDNFLSKPEDTLDIKLKEGVKWKPFSAVIPFSYSKGIINKTISKDSQSLIEVQEFEPEENYFFNEPLFSCFSLSTFSLEFSHQEEANIDHKGLNIHLKELLFTPTVLAVIYHSLRKDSKLININDHLSMNILILTSKFVKENKVETQKKFDESLIIHYNSICDLISQIKTLLFNENSDSTIENTLNIDNFKKLLKIKFAFSDLPPKSFIDLLYEKGELGNKVISKMNDNLDLDCIDNITISKNDDDIKKKQKMKANEIKSKIMNNFNQKITDFSLNKTKNSDDDDDEEKTSDLCSICSSEKENECLFYPIHIYPTKFPFIVDKPPEYKEGEKIGDSIEVSCDDDYQDKFNEEEENQNDKLHENEEEDEEEESYLNNARSRKAFDSLVKEIRNSMPQNEVNDESHTKRYTAGANFVLQFGICQHLLHPSCIHSKKFKCPIDRTSKNGFLPCLDSSTTQKKLSENEINSIELFLNVFKSFIVESDKQQIDVFVELVKSISGLIVTNEIRLRSLPDCLDSNKNKILARNLFLATWHAYRIHGKPKMVNKRPYSKEEFNEEAEDDVESRLTEFQKFIKRLIECDEIETNSSSIQKIVSSFINSSFLVNSGEIDFQRKEKELCLFLRRVRLAEHFLLNRDVCNNSNEIIDWDEILTVENLSKSFHVNFKYTEFEFKPFSFKQLPNEFLRLSQKPYRLPLKSTSKYKTYNLFDFNDLINNYDDLSNSYNEIDENKENSEVFDFKMNDFFLPLAAHFGRKNYPSVLIQIGQNASDVFIFYQNSIAFMDSFYLDVNGLPDVGFVRYQPIFLNHEKYERFIDAILSGEFTDYSHSIYDFMN